MKKAVVYLLAFLILASCSSPLSGIDFGETASPCDFTPELAGAYVTVGGLLTFVDTTAPDGWYADLERDRCRIGVWVAGDHLQDWQPMTPEAFKENAAVVFSGYLSLQPLPDRPDELQLIIEADQPPQLLKKSDTKTPPGGSGLPYCEFPGLETGAPAAAAGEIKLVDQSAAAGVYLEIDEGGCLKRVWVESRFYEEWTAAEQDRLSVGNLVQVEGIYTVVRGEPTVDISQPPELK